MHLQKTGIINRLWRLALSLPGVFSRIFGYGLFFVQFLDFFFNSDMGAQLNKQRKAYKPVPAPHKLLSEETVVSLETHKCPICLKKRENDTALTVSGYVFCFRCIEAHVKLHQSCPVTGITASQDQLLRLFIQ